MRTWVGDIRKTEVTVKFEILLDSNKPHGNIQPGAENSLITGSNEESRECRKAFVAVGVIATAVLVALSLWVAPPGSTYKFSFAILSPILWLIYLLRSRLALHPFHFGLFAAAILLHDLGSFGFYRRKFFGVEFDLFVHFYFGVVAGLVFYRGFRYFYELKGWKLYPGVGGVHELVEWSTTLAMGPERGMVKLDPNDPFDTQKDLLNNLCGAMLAAALYSVAGAKRDPERETRLSQTATDVPNPKY